LNQIIEFGIKRMKITVGWFYIKLSKTSSISKFKNKKTERNDGTEVTRTKTSNKTGNDKTSDLNCRRRKKLLYIIDINPWQHQIFQKRNKRQKLTTMLNLT
jgi:hypothetical protein